MDNEENSLVVAAIFGHQPYLKPVWFVYHGRKFNIRQITYTWTDREGRAKRYHFSVTDGENLFELCYHTECLTWQIFDLF